MQRGFGRVTCDVVCRADGSPAICLLGDVTFCCEQGRGFVCHGVVMLWLFEGSTK